MAKIAYYKEILGNENKLLSVIQEELDTIAEKYGDDRKTEFTFDKDFQAEDFISDDDVVITSTSLGYIKRMSPEHFHQQNRGGKGIKGMQTIENDYIEDLFMTTNHHYVMFFTNQGRIFRIKGYEIPEASRTARGTALVNLLSLQENEKVTATLCLRDTNEEKYLILTTKKGVIKKTELSQFANVRKNGMIAITLNEGDQLIEAKLLSEDEEIFLVTKKGMAIEFNEKDVRATGRSSMGVRGIRLNAGDEVIGMQKASQGEHFLLVSEKGYGKLTDKSCFKAQARGGKGIRCYKITEKTGDIVGFKLCDKDRELLLITTEGIMIRINLDKVSILGRNTSGVKLMDIDKDTDTVIASVAKVRETEDEEESEEATALENTDLREEKENQEAGESPEENS